MYEMMDPQVSRQRREEMLRQAERGRVAGALPADCKSRPDRTLTWGRCPPERFATASRWRANAWPSCCASTNT